MAEPDETKKTAPEISADDNSEPKTKPVEPDAETDQDTDSAVDDIVRGEADDELKVQDEAAEQNVVMKQSRREKFMQAWRNWWENPRKRWGTIAAVLVVLIALFAVPLTRYEILGLFVREKVTVKAVDSQSGAPVSGAQVMVAGEKAETDAEGVALLHVHTGSRQLQVSKKYYKGSTQTVLVTMSAGSNTYKAKLVAIGRQVKVKLVNKISNKPVANAEVKAGGAAAKTDKDGMATVVLPSGATTQQASISLNGYNDAAVTVDANGNLAKNTFAITPSGKIYFLSNLSGTIDVVKTNLDGTDRQTVLAGTGNENPDSTSLLASRDWKYLALLSRRAGNSPSLYLIDTTKDDKLTTIDSGSASFTLVGWSNDQFVYEVDRSSTVKDWQSNRVALKSFDPATGHTLSLDQTEAQGTSELNYAKQSYSGVYLMNDSVVYAKAWEEYSPGGSADLLSGKQAVLESISADGSNSRKIKTFKPDQYSVQGGYNYIGLTARLYKPDELYIDFDDGSGNDLFYEYSNGAVNSTTDVNSNTFYTSNYATYLLSPSGNNTFWTEQRDGKNTLFTGNESGDNRQQIASLSDYSPYGWYSDSYLLVSKNSSELYVMPTSGGKALKITDYYKPPINYNGYGGGYGGL